MIQVIRHSLFRKAERMVGYGELRRLAVKWNTDLSVVECVFALDRLLSAVFRRSVLSETLALNGAAALGKVYFSDYPPVQEAEFVGAADLEPIRLEAELVMAADQAAAQSGMHYRVNSVRSTRARIEFTGPLGRRSAAQPFFPLRFDPRSPLLPTTQARLLQPFSESLEVIVRAVSLEEITARLIAGFDAKPRARDVFDLWFILGHGTNRLDRSRIRSLSVEIAREKGLEPGIEFDLAHRKVLEKVWNAALKQVKGGPSFAEAEVDINRGLKQIVG